MTDQRKITPPNSLGGKTAFVDPALEKRLDQRLDQHRCPSCGDTGKITNVGGKVEPARAGAAITAYYESGGIRGMFSHAKPRPHWVVKSGQVAPCQTCKAVEA